MVPYVLEITTFLEMQLRGKVLRGTAWHLTRRKGAKKKGAIIGVQVDQFPAAEVDPAHEIEPVLTSLWRTDQYLLDVPPDTPKKLILAPSRMRCPKNVLVEEERPDSYTENPATVAALKAAMNGEFFEMPKEGQDE